ncbi:hypothetical protein NLG97_g9577 [Lecanicillium saksenae]|uniref:Uncharacterized protein n=1 Tax=Lecanicillium saksenae TaxID=468837 RepID=A0ACC1QFU7_9HYPO|nr:hypothetical protein NLG97_g9577 [Lecanicillium saksenae]
MVEAARAPDKHGLALRENEEIPVNVYFHIVAKGPKETDGYIPKAKVDEVMVILNDAYAPTPFRFTLLDTDWTINGSWHNDYEGGDNDYAFKSVLRKGNYSDLNVYSLYDGNGGYAGYIFYDQGKTLAHEVGHWLGLLHTFEGNSCEGDGDYIDDTPYELPIYTIPHFENLQCPADLDTCPDQPGYDPIDNYMDYSKDECKNRFTPQHVTRMIDHWKTFRQTTPPDNSEEHYGDY